MNLKRKEFQHESFNVKRQCAYARQYSTSCTGRTIGKTLKEEGIDYEIFQIGGKPVRDCIGCGQCTEKGCVFDDDAVNEFVAKAKEADGFVFGTPGLLCTSKRKSTVFP